MTFEEFLKHCIFYMPSNTFSSNNKLLAMMTFNNPHGKLRAHTILVDKEALLNPNETEKYVAETLFHKLKDLKEI